MINMLDYIKNSNLIEQIDSEEEDQRSLRAWRWLERQDQLDHRVVLTLHRKITRKLLPAKWAGYYRKIPVWIGGKEAMQHSIIQKAMNEWLEYWQHQDPKTSHIQFENIHPFVDGNGRTGRMLMWWLERKQGLEPTLIKYEDRWDYYDWFK